MSPSAAQGCGQCGKRGAPAEVNRLGAVLRSSLGLHISAAHCPGLSCQEKQVCITPGSRGTFSTPAQPCRARRPHRAHSPIHAGTRLQLGGHPRHLNTHTQTPATAVRAAQTTTTALQLKKHQPPRHACSSPALRSAVEAVDRCLLAQRAVRRVSRAVFFCYMMHVPNHGLMASDTGRIHAAGLAAEPRAAGNSRNPRARN